MQAFISSLIDIPTSDPDDSRRRKILNVLLLGVEVLTVFIVISLITFAILGYGDQIVTYIWWVALGQLIGIAVLWRINKNPSLPGWLSSGLFLLFLLFVFYFTDTPVELANGRSLFVFTIPIIISSILLRPASSFMFAALVSIEVSILARLTDTLPNPFAIFSFFFVALISWLSARSLEQALNDLREINANLDKLVEQKTQELAATLAREIALAGRNQAILDSIADGVIVFDANQVSIIANPALSQLTEKPIENLTGIHFSDFVKTGELSPNSQTMIRKLVEHPEKTEAGTRVEWGRKTLSLSVARVQNAEEHKNIGAVAVFRDITSEAELEKMKSTFVAVVSHELRTPLNAIMGYAEMLKEAVYGPINEEQSSAIDRMLVNTGRMLTMVGDLLDEAQLKAGKLSIKNQPFKTASLLKTMHTTMDKIAADKGIYLTDELDPDMPETIIGDAQRLQQIIVNLVNNSARFTEEGGIHVGILRSDPDHWRIEVKDTGLGIPENEIPYIFDTFRQVEETTTRKHKGFGLGLSIVKQLVELQNGKITVKSEFNKGCSFTVILPLLYLQSY